MLHTTTRFCVAAAAVAAASAGVARADFALLTRPISIISGGSGHPAGMPITTAALQFGMSDFMTPPVGYLFDGQPLNASSGGMTLVATAATDPVVFPDIAARLTNGIADDARIVLNVGGTGGSIFGAPEPVFFGLPPGQTDLAGSTVTSIEMHIISINFHELNPPDIATAVDITATMTIFGVPAPSGAALLAAPAFLAFRRRRRLPR